MTRLVLASTSPRRKALLEQLGLTFEIVAPDFDEVMDQSRRAADLATELALGKALSVAPRHPDSIVIAADTVVAFGDRLMSKPFDESDAIHTLRSLRGQRNTVFTGWAVTHGATRFTGVSHTDVWLTDISDEDIEAYVADGEPLDKAGSYAVTGKGAVFIDRISGSIDGAVGLPLTPVAAALKELGVHVF